MNSATDPVSNLRKYRAFQNLPPLAGLASFEEAARPGLSVDESVHRLKRHHYLLKRLHGLFLARLTAEPLYELKMVFSHHSYLCAEQVTAMRSRVGEMRDPPLGMDKVPDPALKLAMDEILAAPRIEELLLGVYEIALPALERGMRRHREQTHVLADQPSRRLLRFALLECADMIDYGRQAIASLVDENARSAAEPFLVRVLQAFAAAGDADGTAAERPEPPQPVYSAQPFRYDPKPRRDERFPDPYNLGVNAEVFLYDETMPAGAKILMLFYKRLREVDVPEMMASIITETENKPWGYYRDMTRQLWDEARHAMMGEVGFASLGIDWGKRVMINFTWSLGLNTQLTPKERHAVLYYIEQGLMPKTGKRYEWDVSILTENALARTFQDFDWADEVLHARVGRDWYVTDMPSTTEAVDYGNKCWSKVLADWNAYRAEGLTQHRNWWRDTYIDYCRNAGEQPDPRVLAYATTYESTRADLKEISVSA